MAVRVKSRDPTSMKRYQKLVKWKSCTKNLFHTKKKHAKTVYNFTTGVSNTEKDIFIPEYQKKFDQFHRLIRNTKAKIEKIMGNCFAGGQTWSPEYKKLTKTIKVWR